MKLIFQTDPRLCKQLNAGGCNIRSIQAIAEIEACRALTTAQIQGCYDAYVREWFDPDCTVRKPDEVLRWALSILLPPGWNGYQIGVIHQPASFAFWGWTGHYAILQGQTAHGFHFRLGDNEGNMIFDPRPGTVVLSEVEALIYRLTE